MRIYAIKTFRRFQRKQRISDAALLEAIRRAEAGNIDADLGEGLIKQRVARPRKGRSGGYRVVVAYRVGDLAVFLFGFAKSDMDNIDPPHMAKLRGVAAKLLAWDDADLETLVVEYELVEVTDDEENERL